MKRQTGYTLTELLVTVAIVAILLGIGIPSYKYVTNSYRMSAELNSLVGDLMYTRAEAIKEGQPVAICTSTNGLTCSGATTWQGGWIVFPDPAGNGVADVPGSILHYQQAFTGTDTLTSPNNPVSAVLFNREGFAETNGAGAGFAATQYDLKDQTASNQWTRCISISAQGMVQIESAAVPTANFPGACP